MARIRSFTEKSLDRRAKHSDTDATWCIVDEGGEKFLQIDTYGSKERAIEGKISQSIRLDAKGAAELRKLIDKAFP